MATNDLNMPRGNQINEQIKYSYISRGNRNGTKILNIDL